MSWRWTVRLRRKRKTPTKKQSKPKKRRWERWCGSCIPRRRRRHEREHEHEHEDQEAMEVKEETLEVEVRVKVEVEVHVEHHLQPPGERPEEGESPETLLDQPREDERRISEPEREVKTKTKKTKKKREKKKTKPKRRRLSAAGLEDEVETRLELGIPTEVRWKRRHLVILQHGLHGTPKDLKNMKDRIRSRGGDRYLCYSAKLNRNFTATHEGIDVCGTRLTEEIEALIDRHALPKGTLLTVVGHSLGGLLLRFAMGKLWASGKLQDQFELESFVTFASPHCGARRPSRDWLMHPLAGFYCGSVIGRTGAQLMLEDSDKEPLLLTMSSPGSVFFEALKAFKRRVLYSNISNDLPVPYCTSAILPKNPYRDKKLKYYENYPHVVDAEETFKSRDRPESSGETPNTEMTPADISIDQTQNSSAPSSSSSSSSSSSAVPLTKAPSAPTIGIWQTLQSSWASFSPRLSSRWGTPVQTSPSTASLQSSSDTQTVTGGSVEIGTQVTEFILFSNDRRGDVLRRILNNLQQLDFIRHDVHFYSPMAHEFIVAKRKYMPGIDVVEHFVDHYLPPTAPDDGDGEEEEDSEDDEGSTTEEVQAALGAKAIEEEERAAEKSDEKEDEEKERRRIEMMEKRSLDLI